MKTREQEINNGWEIYEGGFLGYRTREDASLASMKKYLVAGQNTTVSENGSITVRPGSDVVGTEGSTDTTPIRSKYTFKKRDGTEILMRTFGTRVEWKHPDVDAWDLLQSVTTSGLKTGFATVNINADATSRLYFCNGGAGANDDLWRWNGSIARITSTTSNTIVVQGTTTLANLGFSASGTVIINGTQYTYSGLSSQTFTGVGTDPTGEVAGEPITEIPTSIIDPVAYTNTVGNILLAVGTRLFMAGITGRESTIRYSQFTNPENFGADASPTDPSTVAAITARLAGAAGLIQLPEGGGGVIKLTQFKDQILAVKQNGWTKIKFTDPADNRTSGSTLIFVGDYPVLETLFSHDGKSQVVGAVTGDAVFAGNNGIFAVTQDRRILFLTEVENILSPQFVDISEGIHPTLRTMVWNRSCGIFFEGKAYFAGRSESAVSRNDTVLVYDVNNKTWDLPWLISASDFAIVGNDLHWGSDSSDTSWQQIALDAGRADNALGYTASVTTHASEAGIAHKPKVVDKVFLQGWMTTNTTLEVELLYDRGITSIKQWTLLGTNEEVFSPVPTDGFGLSSFGGTNPFGSSVQQGDLRRFVYILEAKDNLEAFDFSLRLTSTTTGSNWQCDRWGLHFSEVLPDNKKYLKT